MPAPVVQPETGLPRPKPPAPPIRSLLDQVADWTALPPFVDDDEEVVSRYDATPRPAPARPKQQFDRPVSEQPISRNPVSSRSALGRAPAAAPSMTTQSSKQTSSTAPQKRRALTLRLEPESHRRLRVASADLGRTCQDILFSAMTEYLDKMGFDKKVEAQD